MRHTFVIDGDCAFCSTCARFIERRIPTPAPGGAAWPTYRPISRNRNRNRNRDRLPGGTAVCALPRAERDRPRGAG
jgi:hypothetical protein